MVNGIEYSWEDIQIIVSGKTAPLDGAVEIEYTTKKEHFNIHARGDKPRSTGRGKVDYNGKLVLLQSEYESWVKTFPVGVKVTDLYGVNITIAYAPAALAGTVDQCIGCRFTEVKKGMKTGDGNQVIELPFIAFDIKENV